jgi:hypothetical protein
MKGPYTFSSFSSDSLLPKSDPVLAVDFVAIVHRAARIPD